MPSYTSFCWSLGTTSFRKKEFNFEIERQLELLSAFWKLPENIGQNWSKNALLQTRYYDYLKGQNFVSGDAANKPKDAREKTSGLVDIGLIDDDRKLTGAGYALLDIVNREAFGIDNELHLPNDSYIYLKQLLKTSSFFEAGFVRPYLVTTYIMSKLGALSEDEFTFLLPLITSPEKLMQIMEGIKANRKGEITIDELILSTLTAMPNYQEAMSLWLSGMPSEELLSEIGMNRKSRKYDKPYFELFKTLKNLAFTKNPNEVEHLLTAIKALSGNTKLYWKKALFTSQSTATIVKDKLKAVNFEAGVFSTQNEKDFKYEFFKMMHLFKAKATLSDYFDLNRRYFKITDTMLFRDNKVDFDVIPKCYFALIADRMLALAFTEAQDLYDNSDLSSIIPNASVKNETLFEKIEELYGVKVRNVFEAKKFVKDERIARFNEMIDRKFPKEILIDLLKHFESRNDAHIQAMVTNNAEIPTIFEYIIGIIWYNISERRVNILESLNLSLDADLLPKTHAKGGGEDLTYLFEGTSDYPKHTLLIEVTLSEKTNQRRMEMEPVSRHLGDYLLRNKDIEAYCVFVSTYLNLNVIGDFRLRKKSTYYSTDGTTSVNGMKILTCATRELRTIIEKDIVYSQLYQLFEEAFNSNDKPNVWYDNNIVKKLSKGLY